jgi:hypothetical protein
MLVITRARSVGISLGCGASAWFIQNTPWAPAWSKANAMISQYLERFAYSCQVSKLCDTQGCCRKVVAECSILAMAQDRVDFNDGFYPPGPGPGSNTWIEAPLVRIMDGAVNYCFENGKPGGGIAVDFDISATHSETFSAEFKCR